MATIVAAVGGGNWTTGATWVGGSAPTAADDAQLDALSGNVTIDAGAVCRSLDCTGYTGTLTHTSAVILTIGDGTAGAGNVALKLVSGMTYTRPGISAAISYISTSATVQTIDTAGKNMGSSTFNGVGGSWQFTSSFSGTGNPAITLTNGTLDFNDQTVSIGSISTNNSNARTISLGNGTITLTADATVWNGTSVTNLTVNSEGSTIVLSGVGAGNKTFAGGGKTFNDLSITGGGAGVVIFSGANTFSDFTINAPKSVRFPAGVTTTVSSFVATGSAGNLITIDSSSAGSAATLSDASGTNSCDFLSLQDSTAIGGASWFSGSNSINVSGNSGWVFPSSDTGGGISAPAEPGITARAGGLQFTSGLTE